MAAASTSQNPSFIVKVDEEYPYPSQNFSTNIVTVKLSGKDKYDVWNTQMLCLLKSHGMLGFIDGTFICPAKNIGNGKVRDMEAWMRSDSLVKGWILGSLSEQVAMEVVNCLTSKHNATDFTAKHAWDELQRSYGPSVAAVGSSIEITVDEKKEEETKTKETVNSSTEIPGDEKEEETKAKETESLINNGNSKPEDANKKDKLKDELHFWIRLGNMRFVSSIIEKHSIEPTDKITINGNTALHVAVRFSTENHEILKYLLEKIPPESKLSDLVNSDESTLLHVAAIFGNTEAAKFLLNKQPGLLLDKDKEGRTPLAVSLTNMHTKTSKCFIDHIKNDHEIKGKLYSGKRGDDLLALAISSKEFRLATTLLEYYETIHSEAVLMAIAQNFPCELKFWGRIRGIQMIGLTLSYIVWPFIKKRVGVLNDASVLLTKVCQKICDTTDSSDHYYVNPVFEATRQNAYEVVAQIVSRFPNAIKSTNEDGHDFIQYAVINRSEAIYNMLYQMSEYINLDKNIYKTRNTSENNLLHLAAKMAPSNKLNLISGAALQIQRELQWFKEVEGFVNPLLRIQKNSSGETPEMVFAKDHKDLVIEGEKWMKATAKSYTITTALITTIVFAAAITVPGGNNQETGIPIFTNNVAFTIFATSDAISLFTAVTSLLMFLSILTARFPQQDFLVKLPRRLIIGLSALFVSTTTMIIAFGATLFLVFGQGDSRILITICVLTSLAIALFVRLQFHLISDLVSATYGPSIFVKEPSFGYIFI